MMGAPAPMLGGGGVPAYVQCVVSCQTQQGASPTSAVTGNVAAGQSARVLETLVVDTGAGRVRRLKLSVGWVSEVSYTGQRQFVETGMPAPPTYSPPTTMNVIVPQGAYPCVVFVYPRWRCSSCHA